MSGVSSVVPSHDTLPMTVANMTFLVNRLGEDCAPLQFIRELTQNAIDACLLAPDKVGQVYWDVDWKFFELGGVYKLCCIDTGVGMTGPEMVQYINQLSSSIHMQDVSGNFGVGAKIAAAPHNPHGLVYMSWKHGVGHMIHLWYDPVEKVYGLKRWPQNNNEFWTFVSNDLRPAQIKVNGTIVTLHGKDDDDDTMNAPEGAAMKSRWILRYLNSRYFRFPSGIGVHAREGWEKEGTKHNFLREVSGQGPWLDANAESKGQLQLTGGNAHWWIIKEGKDVDSGHTAPVPHMAALYQDELYELVTGRTGIGRLQAFGVIFGYDRVVIYVEPSSDPGHPVSSNTSRTQLLIDGEALPWGDWAAEFRDKMPDELVQLQQEIGAKSGEQDYKKAIQERLKQIRDLMRFKRFRPTANGSASIKPTDESVGGDPLQGGSAHHGSTSSGGSKGGKAGDIYALFAEGGGTPADPVSSMAEPEVTWVSVADGTRMSPFLDDRAATFSPQQNLLQINGDFRVFVDMNDRWAAIYKEVPGVNEAVKVVVREWFTQQLIETVMSAVALKSTGKWSLDELQKLWTEEALTAAVLPRWHIDQSIKRALGQKLGKAPKVMEDAA